MEENKPQVNDVVIDINNNNKVTILYGPFSKQYNYYYQVENEQGQVYKLNSKHMRKIYD